METLKQIQEQVSKEVINRCIDIKTELYLIKLMKLYLKVAYELGGKDVLTKLKEDKNE